MNEHVNRNTSPSAVAWNFAGNFIYALGIWLMNFIIAKHSGEGNYYDAGVYALATSFGNIFLIVSSYGMRTYHVSDISGKYTDGDYIASRFITVGLGGVLCLIASFIPGYNLTQILAINIFMLFENAVAFSYIFFGILQRNDRIDLVGKSDTLRGVLIAVVFAAVLYATDELLIALGAVVIVVIAILILVDYRSARVFFESRETAKMSAQMAPWELIKITTPMLICSISTSLITFLPRILLERIAGNSAVGIFTYIFAPTVIIATFANSVLMPYLTRMAADYGMKNWKRLKRTFFSLFGVMCFVGLCAIVGSKLLGRFVLTLLYDALVAEHVELLMISIGASSVLALTACCNNLLIASRKLKVLLSINIGGCVATAILCFVMIPDFGMYGAGWAILIGSILKLIIGLVAVAPMLFKSNN